jgi:hypothetical protein
MPVNKEELAKDLETPEYQTIVKETLAKNDFVIRTKDEETGFLDRYKNDVIEKEIPKKISEVHSQYDKDVKELFGLDRNQNEKSYDYMKRAASAKLGELQSYADKVKGLEEQIKKGDPTGALGKKLEEAEAQYKAQLEAKDKELGELRGKMQSTERRSAVDTVYAGIKSAFKKELPPLFARTEKAILDEVYSRAGWTDIGGKQTLVLMNADGTVQKDGTFNPITVESYLKTELKEVIEEKRAQGGAGSSGAPDPNAGKNSNEITKDNFIKPETIKSKGDLMDYMLSIGLKRGEKNFNEIWDKFKADLPLA